MSLNERYTAGAASAATFGPKSDDPPSFSADITSQKSQRGELERAPSSLYYRRENAHPDRGWTIVACPDHGAQLAAHHFYPITPGEHPDPEFRSVSWPPELFDRCAFCDQYVSIGDVERCTCTESAKTCPVHGRGSRR